MAKKKKGKVRHGYNPMTGEFDEPEVEEPEEERPPKKSKKSKKFGSIYDNTHLMGDKVSDEEIHQSMKQPARGVKRGSIYDQSTEEPVEEPASRPVNKKTYSVRIAPDIAKKLVEIGGGLSGGIQKMYDHYAASALEDADIDMMLQSLEKIIKELPADAQSSYGAQYDELSQIRLGKRLKSVDNLISKLRSRLEQKENYFYQNRSVLLTELIENFIE